jgi:hypothetical protein
LAAGFAAASGLAGFFFDFAAGRDIGGFLFA